MLSKITLPSQIGKYCTPRNLVYGVIGAFAIIVIVTVFVVAFKTPGGLSGQNEHQRVCVDSLNPSSIPDLRLSSSDLIPNWMHSSTWLICHYLYGQQFTSLILDATYGPTLQIQYPQGSANPSGSVLGGIHFYAQPTVFPATEMCLSYQIRFDANFTWVKGGKLPGLWIGQPGANGGDHMITGSSFRVMWRAHGAGEAYLYVPTQLPSYYNLSGVHTNNNGSSGDSVWRGEYQFQVGGWMPIRMYAKLNTFNPIDQSANYDGILQLTIGNQTRVYSQMKWIDTPHLISGLMMQSFFGGGDPSWATPHHTWISMTDFSLKSNQCGF